MTVSGAEGKLQQTLQKELFNFHKGANNMTKKELITKIAGLTATTLRQAEKSYEGAFQALTDALVSGETVVVPLFGSFSLLDKPARDGINPRNGAKIRIPAAKKVRFRPSKILKKAVNQ